MVRGPFDTGLRQDRPLLRANGIEKVRPRVSTPARDQLSPPCTLEPL